MHMHLTVDRRSLRAETIAGNGKVEAADNTYIIFLSLAQVSQV